MAKMIIMYEKPKDIEGFEKYYFDVHFPIAQKILNIRSESVHRVLNTQNSDLQLYLIIEIEFENIDALNFALASPEAKAANEDVSNLMKFLHKPPIITIVQ